MRRLRLALMSAILVIGAAVSSSCSQLEQEPLAGPSCALERVGGTANACRCSHRIEP